MKTFLAVLIISCSLTPLFSQDGDQVFTSSSKERDTIFAEVPIPKLSAGVYGGVGFISPDKVNDQIELNNSIYDAEESPISRPAQWGIWFAYRPKNLTNFLSLRAEMLTSSRTYSFTTNITQNDTPIIATVPSTTKYRYSVYPFSIGTGAVLFKTTVKAEIGFVFALAYITQETSVPGYSESEATYGGEGYGFRANLQQVIPIEGTLGVTFDIGYRYLVIDEFRDPKGVLMKNTELNYSGINVSAGLSYGF
ncbi:MAG: hypothetical protein WCW40_09245 [Bacteroidota bacterium]